MLSMPIYEVQAANAGLDNTRVSHPPLIANDGYVAITIVNDANWAAMTRAMERSELASDPRFLDIAARTENWTLMQKLMAEWARPKSARDVEQRLLESGVPVSRFRTAGELLGDEHLLSRRTFPMVSDSAGDFPMTADPFRLDGVVTPSAGARVPELGEHTVDVLETVAGWSSAEVRDLLQGGFARSSTP